MLRGALLALLTTMSVGASAAPKDARVPKLGADFVNARGETRHPQLGLTLNIPYGAKPGIYRDATVDWKNVNIQQGRYPGNVSRDQEGEVTVKLTVDKAGKLVGCDMVKWSDARAFNVHACPHLMKYVHFIPELGSDGIRRGGSYEATLSYELIPMVQMPAPMSFPPAEVQSEPRPITQASLETLGIEPGTRPADGVHGIAVLTSVGPDGKVSACTLVNATGDDALDKRMCDSVIAKMQYKPAILKATGVAVEGPSHIYVPWPSP